MPYMEWYAGLKDIQAKARIATRIDRLCEGNFGDIVQVGEGVMEARIHYGRGYRLYFAIHGDEIILLLVGGDKSTQQKDIKKARAYWKDYRSNDDHA